MSPNVAHSLITPAPAPASLELMSGRRPLGPSPQWALDALADSGLAAFLVLDGPRLTYA